MPRRREVPKREILPDPKYGNVELAKFMNVIMQGGKKAVAERIVYGALEQIEKKNPGRDPVEAFTMAINNVKPMVEVKSRRVGGANYQVPVEVPQRRGRTLARRWLVTFSRERREKHMEDKLAGEIIDALEQQGNAFKRKDDMYRMAQANKAFAHYRW
jgi:small subunit ribosomal protein S7